MQAVEPVREHTGSRLFRNDRSIAMNRFFCFLLLLSIAVLPLYGLKRAVQPYAFPNPFPVARYRRVKIIIPVNSLSPDKNRKVDVYSREGILVKRLIASRSNRRFVASWNGRDREQRDVPAGIYFIQITGLTAKPHVLTLILFR